MSRIYFDTEFEGLFPKAGLISIGLTNETGTAQFYAELTDSYDKDKCSEFCKKTVLPLLQHGSYNISMKELKENLFKWLKNQGEDTILICDSIRDIEQMNELFPQGLPSNCRYKVVGFWSQWKRRICNINRHLYIKHNLRDHHALDDAIMNRIIFEGK